ncbi:hypothetical protein SAMN05444722_0459 [Rhodovulum sp. ES.010]|uniref:DUF7742 family protein n=1 Tax=Rhodovulum sp. ES.010 TaxID=1882821 RepID=UPI000928B724|nr:hypothetical protein [Rhodovulum sp. ES.010]SIO11146.1 hypothetical protein SAMN05444722_0459 [Rhodovulum sp. ES.010]
MRPVLHGDAVCAARALHARPPAERPFALARLMARAEAADAYRKRFGRAHPAWGNGSLMALAAREDLPPEPPLDDPDYCRCLARVFAAIAEWREVKARLSGRN